MDYKKSKRLLWIISVIYWLLALMIFLVAGDQFRYTVVATDALNPHAGVGELVDSCILEQDIVLPADEVVDVRIKAATFARDNTGTLKIEVLDDGEIIGVSSFDIAKLEDGKEQVFYFAQPILNKKGERVTIRITTEGSYFGNAISFYYGTSVLAGRFDVVQEIKPEDAYRLNGVVGAGKLCMRVEGINQLSFYRYYWFLIGGVFALAGIFVIKQWKDMRKGKTNALKTVCLTCTKYSFLIQQLVLRDFKTKYKRSALGIVWSFLNPLLSMGVQYIVFSTLFQSNIAHYPVYLLTGIVFFNFFTEACSLGLMSITLNASLINKVYVPKFIYPLTRVLSSLINFALSTIPLTIIILLTGIPIRLSVLLLIFPIFCMVLFVYGMVLLLSSAMVFFRDIQFIWNVLSMVWMYLTPIFYPETIIPPAFITLYHMNPMYQFITFARIVIIDGVSPEPMAYFWCILSSMVIFILGLFVFRKNQNKFVLYL